MFISGDPAKAVMNLTTFCVLFGLVLCGAVLVLGAADYDVMDADYDVVGLEKRYFSPSCRCCTATRDRHCCQQCSNGAGGTTMYNSFRKRADDSEDEESFSPDGISSLDLVDKRTYSSRGSACRCCLASRKWSCCTSCYRSSKPFYGSFGKRSTQDSGAELLDSAEEEYGLEKRGYSNWACRCCRRRGYGDCCARCPIPPFVVGVGSNWAYKRSEPTKDLATLEKRRGSPSQCACCYRYGFSSCCSSCGVSPYYPGKRSVEKRARGFTSFFNPYFANNDACTCCMTTLRPSCCNSCRSKK